MTVIFGILILLLLIFPHETGHFIAAKACGVEVNEFALGMGPAIFKKQHGETLYSLRAIPVGGYCAMEGEDEESDDENAFENKAAWKKAIVLSAGSAMNLFLALLIMIILTFYTGVATTSISEVDVNSPAAAAGLKAGDQITAVNGKNTDTWNEITSIVSSAGAGDKIKFDVLRDGKKVSVTSGVKKSSGHAVIGMRCAVDKSFFSCLTEGFGRTGKMIATLGDAFRMIFTGQVSTKELGGPVAIIKVAGDAGKAGAASFFYLAAFISLNLAIFNLLPFPALDGGRLVFLIIKKITGKRVNAEIEAKVHFAGIVLLFAFMIYVTWNDITRLIN